MVSNLDLATEAIKLDVPKSPDTVDDRVDEEREHEPKECHEQDIVSYVIKSIEREDEFGFLQLEFLQRLNIADYEVKLVRMKSRIQDHNRASATELEELSVMLRDYTTAIRDYQFLRQHQSLGKIDTRERKLLLKGYFMREADYDDPYQDRYLLSRDSNDKLDSLRRFLIRNLPVQFTYTAAEKKIRTNAYNKGEPPLKLSTLLDSFLRFAVSFLGGAFVVIPMLIMSFDGSEAKSLIVVSSAVTIFGLVVSLGIRVSSIETLVATATYAAVLVVFVGSTTGNGNGSS